MEKKNRPAISIPADLADKLRVFSERTGIPMAQLVHMALSPRLDNLISGKASIINGRYVETGAKAAA